MSKKVYFKDVNFSGYSSWHRSNHNSIAMADCDKISVCNACLEPLFLAETCFNNGQGWHKPHKITKRLAEMCGLPAFLIFYKLVGEMLIFLHVKKIAPNYPGGYSSEPRRLSPDQWLAYLEFKQVQHFPNCPKKDLFLKKLKEDPRARIRKAYEKILSI